MILAILVKIMQKINNNMALLEAIIVRMNIKIKKNLKIQKNLFLRKIIFEFLTKEQYFNVKNKNNNNSEGS